MLNLAFSSLDSVLALFGEARFGMDEMMAGIVFMTAGFIMIVTQGFIVGKLTKKFSNIFLVIVGTSILTLAFYGISLSYSFVDTIFWAIPVALGASLAEPTGLSLLSQNSPKENKGEVLGINESIGALMRLIGPLIATTIYTINIVLPWYFNTVVLTMVVFIAIVLYSQSDRFNKNKVIDTKLMSPST